MGSNGEDGKFLVSLETGGNQESIPPNFTSLCKFCSNHIVSDENFQFVGYGRSWDNFSCTFGSRPIWEILHESTTCLFCGEIAKFYNEWSREISRDKIPYLKGATRRDRYRAFFQLHKETGLPINSGLSPEPADRSMFNVNRIRVHFEVPKRFPDSGSSWAMLQFQKCSQPPLQVSNGYSLCDWESAEGQPYNGRIRPLVADTGLFRKWKDTCGDTHGDRCTSILTGDRLSRLRLIDVEKRFVVDNEDGSSYVALSYVWGEWKLKQHSKKMPKLTKLTENDFRKPQSLTREKVLSTIDDAIEVTLVLGEKYLWVDCLCILQKDDENENRRDIEAVEADQREFIPQMDSIYGFASVTIAAASGDNADAGLPGIKPNSRFREQIPFTIDRKSCHVSLVRTLDPDGSRDEIRVPYHYLEDSVWSTRGWVLQEKIFSRRVLIFTKEQVYWECQTASWCEDGFWETKEFRTVYRPCLRTDFRRPWHLDMNTLEGIYKNLIAEYSRRTLTCESDGLDAFEGILNALRREAGQDFLWALPKSLLSKVLTWCCNKQSIKSRKEMCPVRSPDRTTIHCPFPSWSWVGWVGVVDSFLMSSSSDLVFFYLDGKRQMQRVDEADDDQINSIWMEGCIVQGLSWGTGKTDVTLDEIRPPSVLSQSIASNILFFYSSIAKLHVRVVVETEYGRQNLILSDHNGKDVECMWYQTPKVLPGHKETVDFITIGGDFQNTLVVLLVDWKDGVAYRRGLATILGSHWKELDNREWKMICLG